jgi:endonuclease/exonuclease/phosphatase family metal-dependent hydrolase
VSADDSATVLRVMTYNILQGGRRGQALTDVVRATAPDVLLVNESPKTPFTWHRRCTRLCAAWGLTYVDGGRPAGSNMVAVRRGIEVKDSRSSRLAQPRFAPRRGIVSVQLRVGGRLLGVVSCHLSLDRERRVAETGHVVDAADRLRGPVIVAGDLNETPDGPSWRRLSAAGFVDHGSPGWPTFRSEHPTRRIDALLVRGDLLVRQHGDPGVPQVLLAAGSDHRPVLAEVAVEGRTFG